LDGHVGHEINEIGFCRCSTNKSSDGNGLHLN
jgi:hypothetical protein